MAFEIEIGIAIAIAILISNEDRDRNRDLNFGDRGRAIKRSRRHYTLQKSLLTLIVFIKNRLDLI